MKQITNTNILRNEYAIWFVIYIYIYIHIFKELYITFIFYISYTIFQLLNLLYWLLEFRKVINF